LYEVILRSTSYLNTGFSWC